MRDGDDAVEARADRSGPLGRPGLRVDGEPAPRGRQGPRAVHAAIVLGTMMVAFSVGPLLTVALGKPFNKDYDLWQITGRIALDGKDIYPRSDRQLFPFMYPPACATMLAPLSVLPRGAFVASLLLLNSASWSACILLSIYLATGRFRGHRPELYLLPSLAVIPFVHDTYLLGQPALLLLALILGAFALLRMHRPGWAGALLAVATAIKAYPLLAAGYLIYRGHWRAAITMGVTLAGLMFVAPMAFRAPGQVRDDALLWARGMLLKYDEESIGQRPDRAYSFKNQSIQATVHRLARPVLADGEANRTWRVNLLKLDFAQTTLLMLASLAALGLFFLATTWRNATPPTPPADAAERSMVVLLILMVAPLSFNYSYVWLIFPLTLLAHLAGSSPAGSPLRRASIGLIVASVGLLALAIPMRQLAQAYGSVFFSGLVLLIGIGWILRKGWLAEVVEAGGAASRSRSTAARPEGTILA